MIKYVNTGGLNMRSGPGTSYSILMVLTKGSAVDVTFSTNGWSKIKVGSKEGFVSSQYLSNTQVIVPTPISSETVKKAIEIGKSKLGCKYVWGAEGPNTFDCSGFIYYIFKVCLNINIPRVSKEQSKYGKDVNKNELLPGDLIFFDTDGINDLKVSHAGLYLGNNEFIHASSGGGKVMISKLEGYYTRQYVNGKRLI